MFCLAVLPLRPWSNYCVVKFVFSASSSISALFYSCFVFASLFCVHMHVFSHVVVSTFTLPIVQDGASPSPEAALPIQSPHAVRVFSSLSNPAHFPSIPFHSIHFRVLITTEMNHNRLFTSCLPYQTPSFLGQGLCPFHFCSLRIFTYSLAHSEPLIHIY